MSRLTDLRNLQARVSYEIECEISRQRGVGAPPAPPSPAVVRAWARNNGFQIGERGRIPRPVSEAYLAHCRLGVRA